MEDSPLRAELFSVEQLEQHALKFALAHELAPGKAPDKLIARLNENHDVLLETYDLVIAAVEKERRIAPAAEWLLDNFYLIEEQIRTARRHLPRSYSRELPRLANGPWAKYPRVYGIALELISHVDGRLDAGSLNAFIAAYQTITPLKIGELWAVPIMLRLALIENLRRVAARLGQGRRDRDVAADWAEQMLAVVEKNPGDLILVLADMARTNPPLSGAFLAEFTRHLQGQSPHIALATTWIEHRVAEQGLTIERLVQAEGQAQAADQVSIGNSITSLRFLSSTDWKDFVESQSVVEKTLRTDPAQVYAGMDFATRDHYRHAVEQIAKRSPLSEDEVAHHAVELAKSSTDQADARTAHVGFYLIDRGRTRLEALARFRRSARMIVDRAIRRWPLSAYLFVVMLTTLAVSAAFAFWLWRHGSHYAIWPLAPLILICASQFGVGFANWLTTRLAKPKSLPRMDYSSGIPREHRTIVAVPTIISSAEGVQELLEGLEVRFLANRDAHLHFALLTDFNDAAQETMPDDAELVRLAREGIESLNQKYEADRSDIFFLLHRPRRWNAQEAVWMGYERKRGKLMELNARLRGPCDRFSEIVGEQSILSDVRYVITLDTDTQLPRDAARQMVGAMAHTLNRPIFDAAHERVVEGYSILQPRVGVSLPSSQGSWFTRLFAGDSGVDPYTRVVSDVYQDLFGEGSFIGKGIYDVDAFQQSCATFPENAILSHDLLESAHARSALLSDVELYEEYPSRYSTDVSRRHRWMRGDWQIARWLLPRVPALATPLIRNPISALSWWKIFDNLRRSLVPIAMLLLLLSCWMTLGRGPAIASTLFVIIVLAAIPVMDFLAAMIWKPNDLSPLPHWRLTMQALGKQSLHFLFTLIFLPYDAWISADAIVRSLVRVIWTKRSLLEWKTSRDAERSQRADLSGFVLSMWIGPVASIAVASFYASIDRTLPWPAIPFLVIWTLSPLVAWWLSRPLQAPPVRLSERQREFLQKLSRQTWRYFEVFVTAEENWLPPDNVQEQPALAIASRTSPTNIGMALLANLSAYDFGYCSTAQLLDRTAKTFESLGRMERHRGHFFNWYDTRSLKPLPPRYVSMVDSGNLAGHLLVLRAGLIELIDAPVLPAQYFAGLRDTLGVLLSTARGSHLPDDQRKRGLVPPHVLRQIERLQDDFGNPPNSTGAAVAKLRQLMIAATEIRAVAGDDPEVQWWSAAFERACGEHQEEIQRLAAWASLPPLPEGIWTQSPAEQVQHLTTLRETLVRIDGPLTLREVAALGQSVLPLIDIIPSNSAQENVTRWIAQLRQAIHESSERATQRIQSMQQLVEQCRDFADMDFTFLLDHSSNLFSIGYNVSDQRLDNSFYDLLASEARLGSFVAIAQGQAGLDHWFALGRLLTAAGGAPALLSWSGSMFEYLMPLLVMPTYDKTLLDQTYRAVVRRQIDYGIQRGVPWGISESGYNTIDQHFNYQYRAFGVPGLGLKRGLAEDLVIAPYATAMALMVAPEAACRNLERMFEDGVNGAYGFYEAIDFTPSRLSRGESRAIVRQFMAHHQGMSLLSLEYLLLDRPMQRRFDADPMLRSADLLLQERVPQVSTPVFPHTAEAKVAHAPSNEQQGTMRVVTDPSGTNPEVHLLSNGNYHVVISSAGGGYSRWRDLAVTRWREDATRDCYGTFLYLRDLDNGAFWSTAFQPTLKSTRPYEAVFTQARAEFRRRDHQIETHTEISVSPEDDIELRRVTITNRSEEPRTIEVTSYAEVVLANQSQDLSHPAFSNLFVQTELVRHRQAIVCTRRPRSAQEHPPWMVHLMTVRGTTTGEASFETDRMKFIGRARNLANPAAMEGPLSDSAGSVLDPVVSIRHVIHLKPNELVRVDLITGVGETREAVVAMMDKYHDPRLADRVFELAWTHSQVLLRQLNASESDAQAYGRLAGSIVYASSLHRARTSVLTRNRRGQSGLWGYGISGDLPIVLVRIRDQVQLQLIHQALQAHAYWRMKGLSVDLVIWNEDDPVYRQQLQDRIMDLVAGSPESALVDKPGGVFVRRGEQMSEEDRALLQTVARVILQDDAGTLAEQVERKGRPELSIAPFKPRRRKPEPATAAEVPHRELAFFNGLGGFSPDGREYIMILSPEQTTPAPWTNVLANPQFGTIVTESGGSYTWSENSHEFRLTPWYNDPVSDTSGEAIYIRDEETGRFWSPTPLPARGGNPYVARHGFGYSIFEYAEDGINSELSLFVATDAPVKFARLRISNRSGRSRQLSVTGYWEWVLGELRNKTLMHVITELDPISGALFTRNAYNSDFPGRVAFVDCSEPIRTVTADRTEFLGRNGTPENPASMRRVRLSGRVGAGLDPCIAMQIQIALEDGQDKDIVFILGAAQNEEDARQLAHRYRGVASAQHALEGVWRYWARRSARSMSRRLTQP
jgi:cellobiose phosphorylase/PAS domain-containing protein